MATEYLTVFRSRLDPDHQGEYDAAAPELERLAVTMPGLVEVKAFVAEDGERLTLVRFVDRESHEAWRDHPVHRAAQRRGREVFYLEYSTVVAEVRHASNFTRV